MSNAAVSPTIADAPIVHEPDATSGMEDEARQVIPWALEYGKADEGSGGGTLKQRTIRSSMFTIGGYGVSQLLRFVRAPLMAYLLNPDALGLMAIVALVLGMFQQFSDVGLAPAIIRSERGDDRRVLNTAWTLSVARGLILFVCTLIVAYPIARFYHEPRLFPLVAVAGFNAVTSGFYSTSVLTLSRHLKLGRTTLFSIAGEVVNTTVCVLLAWRTHSVWSMVAGGFAANVVCLAISFVLIPGYRVWFGWDRSAARELFHFGKWIFLSTALTYFANESDRLILGKLVPIAILGFYSQAVTLTRMPWEVISRLAGTNLFPALARCAGGPREEFARKVRTARSVILPMGAAAVIGLAMGAPLAVSILYDARYAPIGWMAQLLAVGLWVTILQSSADRALLALGKAGPLALTNFVNMVLTIACSLTGYYVGRHFVAAGGTNYAIQGLILGVAVGNVGGHVVVQAALRRNGVSILAQDLKYTAVVAAVGVLGVLVHKQVIPTVAGPHGAAAVKWAGVAWGAAVIGTVCAWSGVRALKWMRR